MYNKNLKYSCTISIPADDDFGTVVRMMLCGCCAIYNMDISLIEDIKVASDEAICCLLNQPKQATSLEVTADKSEKGVIFEFIALPSIQNQEREKSDVDITKSILETLIPKVNICSDDRGVFCITFYFPEQ